MIMSSSLNFGVKKSLPHFLGICIGFPTMVLLAGMGVGALFITFPLLQHGVKIIGATYMLYLAWQIAISHIKENQYARRQPLTFLQACLFQWVNPKAWVMGMGAIAAYTVPGATIFYQILFICLIFLIIGAPCISVWLFFGAALRPLLQNKEHKKYFNYTMSLLLVISIALVFIK
jgi:threonine/homoserine/homoserine lactone efflux protein